MQFAVSNFQTGFDEALNMLSIGVSVLCTYWLSILGWQTPLLHGWGQLRP